MRKKGESKKPRQASRWEVHRVQQAAVLTDRILNMIATVTRPPLVVEDDGFPAVIYRHPHHFQMYIFVYIYCQLLKLYEKTFI